MNEFWKDEPEIASELETVGSLIRETVDRSHTFVRQLLAAQIQTSGKLLRPALVLIGSRLGDPEKRDDAIRIASVLEMIHLASLVHDDIIDNASVRRGVSTLNARVGAKQAVLAGDYLLSRAMALVGGKEGDLEASAVSNAFSRLCQSEIEQDAGQGDYDISISTYLRRIAGKTASLFALSSYAGAAITESPRALQYTMHRIGYCLGMAFQIQDDMLDYEGDGKALGKEPGKDLLCGVPTLPLLETLDIEKQLPTDRQILHHLTRQNRLSKRDAMRGVEQVINVGGLERSRQLAQSYMDRAFHAIESLQNDSVERQLHGLFAKLSTRKR